MNSNQLSKLGNNGFINFDFDMDDDKEIYSHLKTDNPASIKAEDVAYIYLNKYLQLKDTIKYEQNIPSLPKMRGFKPSPQYVDATNPQSKKHQHDIPYKYIETQELRITDTHLVKFRQLCEEIPIYGSVATVELDKGNELIGISANFGKPHEVSSKPTISEQKAKSIAIEQIEKKGYSLSNTDLDSDLYYYFDSSSNSWRLVYIVEIKTKQKSFKNMSAGIPKLVDYIIDAHDGKVISQLPRVRTLTSMSKKTNK